MILEMLGLPNPTDSACSTCGEIYSPVCGDDYETHDNECVAANCDHVNILCYEECPCSDVNVSMKKSDKKLDYSFNNVYFLVMPMPRVLPAPMRQ